MSESDDIDRLRERRKEELVRRASGEGSDGAASERPDGRDSGTPEEPVHVESPAQFEDLTGTHDVVLVDFYADWCGPCKMLEPTVAALAAESDAAVLKVDVDRHQGLAQRHGVRGVPTIVLYADGEPVEQVVGVKGRDELAALVERYA